MKLRHRKRKSILLKRLQWNPKRKLYNGTPISMKCIKFRLKRANPSLHFSQEAIGVNGAENFRRKYLRRKLLLNGQTIMSYCWNLISQEEKCLTAHFKLKTTAYKEPLAFPVIQPSGFSKQSSTKTRITWVFLHLDRSDIQEVLKLAKRKICSLKTPIRF